jgi:Holliday junction resolvase
LAEKEKVTLLKKKKTGGAYARRRGKNAEIEFCHWLGEHYGIVARRGVQYSGMQGSPDVVADVAIHFEVKRRNALNFYDAVKQAVRDAGCSNKVPVVASRRDHGEWLFTMRAIDARRFAKALLRMEEDDKLGVENG